MRPFDNFTVKVTSGAKEDLVTALELISRGNAKAHAWAEKDGVLYLLWRSPESPTTLHLGEMLQHHKFPCPLSGEGLVEMVWAWLKEHVKELGYQPDIDGHCTEGFTIQTTSTWGAVYASVEPTWLEHSQ